MPKKILIFLGIIFLMNSSIAYDCKLEGCPLDYRCMSNGECTPLLVKQYCEDHGKPFYVYNVALIARNCNDILDENEQRLCTQCKGDYELRKNASDIENIIYGITAGLAILMLGWYGIGLITARNPDERDNAKRAVLYVVFAVVVIAVATKFVEYLLL